MDPTVDVRLFGALGVLHALAIRRRPLARGER
jgi:hypothetical protein